jgi:hypothetical protein
MPSPKEGEARERSGRELDAASGEGAPKEGKSFGRLIEVRKEEELKFRTNWCYIFLKKGTCVDGVGKQPFMPDSCLTKRWRGPAVALWRTGSPTLAVKAFESGRTWSASVGREEDRIRRGLGACWGGVQGTGRTRLHGDGSRTA